MRGESVFRVYGCHRGRERDSYFGVFRTRAEAETESRQLSERDGGAWAAKYHDAGFVVREHQVETDFEIPSLPTPRDRFVVKETPKPNQPGEWNSTIVEVFRDDGSSKLTKVAEYVRNHAPHDTFEPFRQGDRLFALISRNYTMTAVLDLATGEVIAEESEDKPGCGFCPVGFFVPDWWDVHDASIIPGSEYWDADCEWPTGDLGFVWGCYWGDDTSWKVQYLDLRRVRDGLIGRDDRFGYVSLATAGHTGPRRMTNDSVPSVARSPSFIELLPERRRVGFSVELDFNLATGDANPSRLKCIAKTGSPFE